VAVAGGADAPDLAPMVSVPFTETATTGLAIDVAIDRATDVGDKVEPVEESKTKEGRPW
jgi:hypothetical protein